MSYKYFTINERNKLEVLLKENYKISKIAKILNRHRATIYREIKRINGEYSSENAQEDANTKSANKGRNSKITAELKNLIEDRLCKTWSPEQIVGRELKGRLSFKTIYNWGCTVIFWMFPWMSWEEREGERKLRRREENLILGSQLATDPKK